jgi:hypothetical protein
VANIVEILVKANTSQATTGISKFTSSLNSVVQGLTGFTIAQLSASGAIIAGANAIKNAVIDWATYVEEIRKFSSVTGMAAEESSRLIQVADDMRISSTSMATAMRMMAQNGVSPSIEAIAALSDQFLAAEDAAARAKLAQKVFGEQWAALAPLLEMGGAAIIAQTAAVESNLVVTEKAIEQTNEYMLAMDAWEDTVTGVKNEIGLGLMPALTGLLQTIMEGDKRIEESGAAWMQHIPILQQVIAVWAILQGVIESVVGWVNAYNSAAAAAAAPPSFGGGNTGYNPVPPGAYQPPAGGGGTTPTQPPPTNPYGPNGAQFTSPTINVYNQVDSSRAAANVVDAVTRRR